MRKRKPFARIFSLLAVLVILVSAFSIPAGALDVLPEVEPYSPRIFADHYVIYTPRGTGYLEEVEATIPLSTVNSEDIVVWVQMPYDVAYDGYEYSYALFGRDGVEALPPYPRVDMNFRYKTDFGNYAIGIISAADWANFINTSNGTNSPNRISYYLKADWSYVNSFGAYEFGISKASDFFGLFNDLYQEYGDNIGTTNGYNDGYNDGYSTGKNEGYEEGFELGQRDGYGTGYTEGSENGYKRGHEEGFLEGEEWGFSLGEEAGLAEGYQNGYSAAEGDVEKWGETWHDMVFSVVDAPLKALSQMFNFTIFGVDVSAFVFSLFSLCIVLAVVRLFI